MKPIRCHADNLAKHGISEDEVNECLSRTHLRLRNPLGGKKTYLAVGKTLAGRFLEIVFEDHGHFLWVFHAMTARPRLVKLFKKRRKQYGL